MLAEIEKFDIPPRQMNFWEVGNEKYSECLDEIHVLKTKQDNTRKGLFARLGVIDDTVQILKKAQDETLRVLFNQCGKESELRREIEVLRKKLTDMEEYIFSIKQKNN